MNILAFDTAYSWVSAALQIHSQRFFLDRNDRDQNSQTILPCISYLMSSAAIQFSDLDAIGVGIGPGRFTGTRVAVCVAQGIGFARRIPIVPLSSLQLLATEGVGLVKGNIWVLMQAKIGFIYCGLFSSNDLSPQLFSEKLCTWPELTVLAKHMDFENDIFITDQGALLKKFSTHFPKQMRVLEKAAPNSNNLLQLTLMHYEKKKWFLPHELKPNYLSEWI